ncbi:MAG: hypothetical protein C4541_05565 [Candidatus Auribacter fodinae]|jgi:ribonuclease Z|uniref:Uncharacterized protein n=1 Tax=Candidatus Auribacter fodinae TaxID=2093366 RepID=A0A3A4R0T8_9BACT|nr:MAG: hypothetical protein C4541_05565 [Candidatus Auribacter fodinae]
MRYITPQIVGFFNDDHSLYVDVQNIPGKQQSILIDCGNNHTLTVKEFLKISTVLISHAHIDHFIGFDNILRMNLRENKRILVVGPAPMSRILSHRLQGYMWNLIYDSSFEVEAWDIHPRVIKKYLFKCREGFSTRHFIETIPANGTVLDNDYYTCSYIRLKHDITSIGYSIKEKDQYKIDKTKLHNLGLQSGSWLSALKKRNFAPTDTIIASTGKTYSYNRLYEMLVTEEKGFKLTYITDTILDKKLEKSIVQFAYGSDEFYCEATFLDSDIQYAKEYYHLTAKQTGKLAKNANVKVLYLLHLSQRYANAYSVLDEARSKFQNTHFPPFNTECMIKKKV